MNDSAGLGARYLTEQLVHNLFNTTALLSINKVLATEDITLDDEAGIPVSIFSEIKV